MRVSVHKAAGKWVSWLMQDGVTHAFVGEFDSQQEALQRGLFAYRFLANANNALRKMAAGLV